MVSIEDVNKDSNERYSDLFVVASGSFLQPK